jgi:hypothetical protein
MVYDKNVDDKMFDENTKTKSLISNSFGSN